MQYRGAMSARSWLLFLPLAALALWLLLPGLGASFSEEDEALYSRIALEMRDGGTWLTPHYQGEPFLHKPPLGLWLIAAGQSAGSGELGARLPSVVAALCLLALVFWTAGLLAGPLAGLAAGAMLLLGQQFLFEHFSRSAVFDPELALACFAAVVCGGEIERDRRWAWPALLALLAALHLKAPVAGVPVLAVGIHLALADRRGLRTWLTTVAAAGALALPWHVYQLVLHGEEFWSTYFVYEFVGRLDSTAGLATPGRWVHFTAVLANFHVWTPVLALGLALPLARPAVVGNGRRRLLVAYVLLWLLILTVVRAKWPWYVIPAYPALVVLGAALLEDLRDSRAMACGAAVLGVLAGARWLLLPRDPSYLPATRASVAWPEHSVMLRPALSSGAALLLVASLALAGLLLWWLLSRYTRLPAYIALIAAVAIFARDTVDLSGTPRSFVHPLDRIARELDRDGMDLLVLSGFRHPERYDERLEPLPGYYLTAFDGPVLDMDASSARAHPPQVVEADRLAVVIAVPRREGADTVRARLQQAVKELGQPGDPAAVWLYTPGRGRGYRRLRASSASPSGP
jgi:hypothetical protein